MEQTTICGMTATVFGVNNYSNGMNPVVFASPYNLGSIKQLKSCGYFLNPFAEPDSEGVYALRGTEEQFKDFFEEGKEAWATKEAQKKFSLMNEWEQFSKFQGDLLKSFVPWYEK